MLYRVVELRRVSFFSGWATAQELQDALNRHAAAGWVLEQILAGETSAIAGLSGKKVYLLVFRTDPPVPAGMKCEIGGEKVGVTKEVFTHLASAKRITPATLTSVAADTEWRPLSECVPELAALLA